MSKLTDLGEDGLVARLVSLLPQGQDVVVGPGDDCAVVRRADGSLELLKTDVVVEDVHFLRSAEPERIGRKALARAISDIAAMGGIPRHALVTLVLPSDLNVQFVERLYLGLTTVAQEFQVSVVGGETARGQKLILSVALTGDAPEKPILRSGGKVGDRIWVTGTLGGSIRGKHFDFTPRVAEAHWLVKHFPPTAMMDLSDGLAADLPRLAEASKVGWNVDDASLPRTPGGDAWNDGEDYELLFTTTAQTEPQLTTTWASAFPHLPLTPIGWLTDPTGDGPSRGGWDHFRELA
jgi:thiamine-monophosphate kinase